MVMFLFMLSLQCCRAQRQNCVILTSNRRIPHAPARCRQIPSAAAELLPHIPVGRARGFSGA